MFPFYCNKCYRQRKLEALTLDFYISTICKHVICDICLGHKHNNNNNNSNNIDNAASAIGKQQGSAASTSICPICQCEYHGVAISKELPTELVSYFDDPMRLVKRYQDICKFQAKQNELLNIHYTLHCEKKRSDLKRKRDAFQKIITKLEKYALAEKEKITKLSGYIDWHGRHKQRRAHANDDVVSMRPNTPYISKMDDNNNDDDDKDNKAVNEEDEEEEELGHNDSGVGSKSTSVLSYMK